MAQSMIARDLEIQRQVLQELHWDSRIDPAGIGVAVRDGVVTLSGVVSNYAEKAAAQDAAHRVSGVLDVANDIEVVISPTHARTDAEIAHAVRADREARRIRVEVKDDGIVALFGSVRTWLDKQAILGIVGHAPGIREVQDNLRIDPFL